MFSPKQLQRIKDVLEYQLEVAQDQHGYDAESFFADRHWSQIENDLAELIKAVENQLMGEKEFSLVSKSEQQRWPKDCLPELTKGEIFDHLSSREKLFQDDALTFDYALPQTWLDDFVKRSGLEYHLVLGTTIWAYLGTVQGPVSCCIEVQRKLEKLYYER